MLLRCIRAFGNFKPGEEVEVPDGAAFDQAHFSAWSVLDELPDEDEDQDKEGSD